MTGQSFFLEEYLFLPGSQDGSGVGPDRFPGSAPCCGRRVARPSGKLSAQVIGSHHYTPDVLERLSSHHGECCATPATPVFSLFLCHSESFHRPPTTLSCLLSIPLPQTSHHSLLSSLYSSTTVNLFTDNPL